MADNSKLTKIRLILLTAAAATGIGAAGSTASANDELITPADMYSQAVALYEKLSREEVAVPQSIIDSCGSSELAKAVVLGFANADDVQLSGNSTGLRKQDALTVLYKTIIDFDDSFALTSEEVDEIMNKCYDNALIDEANRVGYAFMLKHRIIDSGYNTEPNKEITWESCDVLINGLYDLFVQDISFDMGGTTVKIGANIETVTDILGQPARIDKGDYGFDWYVFNSDYNYFMMVGVDNGRICAFFSNSRMLAFDDIKAGSSIESTYKYMDNDAFRFFEDEDGNLDAILYNTYSMSDAIKSVVPQVRGFELTDMINAYRAKHDLAPVKTSMSLTETAQSMAPQPKYIELAGDASLEHIKDGAEHETGCDTFEVYRTVANTNGECLSEDNDTIGIGTYLTDKWQVVASIMANSSYDSNYTDIVATDSEGLSTLVPEDMPDDEAAADSSQAPVAAAIEAATDTETDIVPIEDEAAQTADGAEQTAETAEAETNTEADTADTTTDAAATDNVSQVLSPAPDSVITSGEDMVIELADSTIEEYYVKIYSIEDDEFIVNSYVKPENGKLIFESSLFTAGKDYTVSVSAVTETDAAAPEEFTVTYGETPDDAIVVSGLENEAVIDDDYINLTWSSALYHDFIIDVYDGDGQLLMSQNVSDSFYAKLKNVQPGSYNIHISALRRGTEDIIKSEKELNVTVKLPDPIITEYILEDGEMFYPVYEDEEMGLVYFYDEELVDIDVTADNGKTSTVRKKKITEKQVKATDYYRTLANAQQRVECFIGSNTLQLATDGNGISTYVYSGQLTLDTNEAGSAIVAEAVKYLSVPYLWGGTTPSGFDCSGFAQYVYRNVGININRTSQAQYLQGTPVSRENLQPGDLVFFQKGGDVHHVGIYVGDGMMIHAPYTGSYVQFQSIDTSYYKLQFCGGRRIYAED